MSVFEHLEYDQHEKVVFCHDVKSGLKAIIAVHNTNLGPSLGGCRMFPYADSAEALTDVLRLSKGMTYKAAMANLPQGGGKAVIIGNPRSDKNHDMFLAFGEFINKLGGDYITAEDSGISVADLTISSQKTQFVSGIQAKFRYDGSPSDGNPASGTAYGVFVGLQASVKHQFNSDLKGVNVAIQGLGHVGYRLAGMLHSAGAHLFVTDIYPEQLEKAKTEFGATIVAPEEIFSLDVDVFAPCAMGATINEKSIPQLKAKVVAGAANNQLAHESLGLVLREKGILYAPDYVINAGGIIDIYHQTQDGTPDDLKAHLEAIGDTLNEIYTRTDGTSESTNVISNQIAQERFNS